VGGEIMPPLDSARAESLLGYLLLHRDTVEEFRAWCARRGAGTADARQLYDETEGSPLFIVEALRAGWTAGRALSPRAVAEFGRDFAEAFQR
jgi:hypothetical protein